MALPQVGLDAVITGLGGFQSGASTISKAYSDLDKQANTLGGSTINLGNSLLKMGAIAGGAAVGGVVALGAALTTFAVSGISKAVDLDQQMANIAATMGKTKEEVTPLKDEILKLSLDPN